MSQAEAKLIEEIFKHVDQNGPENISFNPYCIEFDQTFQDLHKEVKHRVA